MSRGIRGTTKEKVDIQRERKPHAFGPWVASVAISLNIPPSMVARMSGAHEQTVLRWFTGQSTPTPNMLVKFGKIAAFLAWLSESGWPQLIGTVEEREEKLADAMKMFRELTKAPVSP
jgi:hypothetical protein